MENKYAVVKVCADGVNPEVYIFNNKKKAKEALKELWKRANNSVREYYRELIEAETWCDSDGDCARITFSTDDWIYYQVVEAKEE